MTRACLLLLRLDLQNAMRHNPLVVFVAPFLALQLAELLLSIVAGRKLVERWPCWFSNGFQALFVAGFSGLAAIRIVAWFWPPSVLGMFCPPETIQEAARVVRTDARIFRIAAARRTLKRKLLACPGRGCREKR